MAKALHGREGGPREVSQQMTAALSMKAQNMTVDQKVTADQNMTAVQNMTLDQNMTADLNMTMS